MRTQNSRSNFGSLGATHLQEGSVIDVPEVCKEEVLEVLDGLIAVVLELPDRSK